MAKTTCPACDKKAEGSFCSWCGAALDRRSCAECGADLDPGARFCNACGAAVGARSAPEPAATSTAPGGGASGGGGKGSPLTWAVATIFMVGFILIVAIPVIRQAQEANRRPAVAATPAPATGGAAGGGAPSAADIANMSPREAADRLYDRIMRTAVQGDSASVSFFLPMGIDAYERARPLDADGLFHLSLLQRMAQDPEAGLATAREALTAQPNHLLNLASAGGAAAEMGDTATAREYYSTFLEVYDSEMENALPEYELHREMMPELIADAERVTGG